MKRYITSISHTLQSTGNTLKIYYDMETTGLEKDADITQLAWSAPSVGKKYMTYVYTPKKLSETITSLTGITQLHVSRAPKLQNALDDFFNSIKSCVESSPYDEVALISFNGQRFDDVRLEAAAKKTTRGFFKRCVSAHIVFLVDALVWCREIIQPDHLPRTARGTPSYRQRDIYYCLFQSRYEEHRADADTDALARICDNPLLNYNTESNYCRLVRSRPISTQPPKKKKKKIVTTYTSKNVLNYLRQLHNKFGLGHDSPSG
jgi:DNA polymerase III alpha subunit (gram-positive type)